MRRESLIALICIVATNVASAEILATCGASQGYAYYPPGAYVGDADAGWQEDAISKGSFQLVRSGEEFDIFFTDASGGTLSTRGDGGVIHGTFDSSGNLLVHVIYPGKVFETYIFWFAVKGEGSVTYSQAKHGARIWKHSLMKAACTWPPKAP
jgi:hypothetical protein